MFESSSDSMQRQSGFTLIELITIVVILGIMAVVAVPRMVNMEYRSQEFRDRTVSALRYAQKTAVSHRRMVCVTFTATTVTLALDTNNDNVGCENPLVLPGGNGAVVQSGDAARAFFAPVPADFNYLANGTSTAAAAQIQITVSSQPPIILVRDTGYVQ